MRRQPHNLLTIFGFAIAGLILGLVVVRSLEPTNDDVRAEARALVPPGTTVTEFLAGHDGNLPPRGPYKAHVRVQGEAGPGEAEKRVDALRRHAEALG